MKHINTTLIEIEQSNGFNLQLFIDYCILNIVPTCVKNSEINKYAVKEK